MIDAELFQRYQSAFGDTFTAGLWERRPGDAVNTMMRAALAGTGPAVTDELIAEELATRVEPPRKATMAP
ncbi:MAG TPA: hypothetical protein VEB64_07210 [Azospirillaceae bacterium]|nr:hypothetical protein [Azospirillaceae bacterium]